jgi:hypothetical protein
VNPIPPTCPNPQKTKTSSLYSKSRLQNTPKASGGHPQDLTTLIQYALLTLAATANKLFKIYTHEHGKAGYRGRSLECCLSHIFSSPPAELGSVGSGWIKMIYVGNGRRDIVSFKPMSRKTRKKN